jgi:EmrB/QacA subfamily drug resistance transporter
MNRRTVVLLSMTLANAMVLVDQTAVPLALPSVMSNLHVGSQLAQWVLTASLLPVAGLLVLGGRLGDTFGRRRVFLVGCGGFVVGSALGGASPSFSLLLLCRVVQGIGGALMLPNTVAIVSSTFSDEERGRALGTMGGTAAVAGALGPTIGGALTNVFDWRAVLLINVPLAIIAVLAALRSVPASSSSSGSHRIDLFGSSVLTLAIVALVFGLSQSQTWGFSAPVLISLIASVVAVCAFVATERCVANPLVSFDLLRRHPSYTSAVFSQLIAGMAEMGLALLFPLILILNLRMSPVLAGLALIPTTVPMVFVAPLAGRWYDRVGGRPPLVLGFALLAASGVAMAIGIDRNSYLPLLPGLLIFGVALALILTVNDPVSLEGIPPGDQGQASGVSATAEQFGGAVGIAGLYLAFHTTYADRLTDLIAKSSLPSLSSGQQLQFKNSILVAEQTGLNLNTFNHKLEAYLPFARTASDHGYVVALLMISVLAAVGCGVSLWLTKRPPPHVREKGVFDESLLYP